MKLGILTTGFVPYQWYAGLSNAVYLTSKRLNEKYGFEVNIFAPLERTWEKKEEVHKNFTVKRFNIIDINKLGGYYTSTEAFKLVSKEDFDLIHSFHYGYFPATVGFKEARTRQIPHFFTTAYHPPGSFLGKRLISIYNTFQGKSILSKSNAVLPFNNNEKNQLSKISKGRFEVVPCPVNQEVFKPAPKTGKLNVLFVGAMEPWKGPHIAVDILKEIEKERNDVRFTIVGNGLLPHQRALYDKLKKKAGKNFTFTRDLTVTQLAALYRKADILIAPTKYESFGLILAEAMMSGTPIVSTKVGAVPETVGQGGLLVDYGNWEGMKNNITTLLDDSSKRKKLSQQAIKQSNKYRVDVVTDKIYKLYKSA